MTASTLPLFRNSDERDDAGHRLSMFRQVAEALTIVRHDPDVADYRLGVAGGEKPLLPTQIELDAARVTIRPGLVAVLKLEIRD